MEHATCPYCNATLEPSEVGCPRCGEPLPGTAAPAPVPSTKSSPTPPAVPGRWRTLAAIVGIMLTMAVVGLSYALWTTGFRRANDFRTKKGTPPVAASAAPAQLSGLLPTRCNLIASLNVAEALKHATTRRLLDAETGAISWLLGNVKSWTGLEPRDLEYVAIGTELADRLPQLFIVLQTRQPYGEDRLAARTASGQLGKHRERALARVRMQPTGEALLWRYSERVLVAAVAFDAAKSDDLNDIPEQPRSDGAAFSARIQELLQSRVPKQSVFWLVGDLTGSTMIRDALPLMGVQAKELAPWLRLQAVTLALVPQEDLTLVGHFLAAGPKEAKSLENWLEEHRLPGAKSYKVEGPATDLAGGAESWVTLQIRGDAQEVGSALGQQR